MLKIFNVFVDYFISFRTGPNVSVNIPLSYSFELHWKFCFSAANFRSTNGVMVLPWFPRSRELQTFASVSYRNLIIILSIWIVMYLWKLQCKFKPVLTLNSMLPTIPKFCVHGALQRKKRSFLENFRKMTDYRKPKERPLVIYKAVIVNKFLPPHFKTVIAARMYPWPQL